MSSLEDEYIKLTNWLIKNNNDVFQEYLRAKEEEE